MDVIDLWELLSNVDDWSFETFPWDLFSLCHSTVLSQSTSELPIILPKSKELLQDGSEETETAQESNNEILSFNHVPSEQVPIYHQVSQTAQFNQSNLCHDISHHQKALESSESEETHSNESNDSIIQNHIINCQTLEESMLALQLSLEDKSALSMFEKLSKKKINEPMDIAKLPENVSKNRYKDVLPYDESRVVLKECAMGDYINASYVQMNLPQPRKPNEYIATQGPLPHTCDDFWQMVWEQQCGIIVMVTTLKERNRVKCHQYWPDHNQTEIYAHIQVTCFSEVTTNAGVTRDFLVTNQKTNEERHVIQLQYITWPDHGVPEDSTDFLQFVQNLRELRRDVGGYVVVHCSAGVGRTGVLILMETAIGYIEADEPIYPLELVKRMRDQRVMMVQTVIQYKFICEALLKAYKDHCEVIAKNNK